ncbi:hypothetical protein E3P92_03776 [Wallemia ichthyophaga]|uniref:Uncharacterized protein n=2 Tax=Wallemia ichthyophaga TaxID=245174 RepID=A0A4T0EUH0_WALIC|nr:uncharacterized protein J056_002932 [Wallemia ichthyophaga EXF-994]TIA69025.1 hypothetical protein E3P91_03814 [Wallemia ichthyophaga]EOR03763.1 hypothetical protein J056_002932 [Wallemia ichthyophaga EXF-994]TIA78590.1 hypothetical protein E3P98_03770 [Wallemia ichthyophaga]TIA89158.1 hypothetical protein E3P97_03156 [Wallemia ichthyophaga]TIA95315.1 hypothetical protein E3P95_03768 [Wallemia ichthyophaga]
MILNNFKRFLSFIEVLLFLPLTLNISNKQTFLTLSLFLTCYYTLVCTLRLFNSRWIGVLTALISAIQPLVIPLLLLTSFHLQSPPCTALSIITDSFESILHASSPTFSLLEGASSLLCIQAAGQFSRLLVRRKGETGAVFFLILSSIIYVTSGIWLIHSYPAAASTPFSASLIGAALVATLALSALALTARRATVIETSLMFAYIAYSIWLCADAIQGASGWIGFQWSFDNQRWVIQSLSNALVFLKNALGDTIEFVGFAFATLPPTLLVSLIFRTSVLYLATKIIPLIRSSSSSLTDSFENAADPDAEKRLQDDEPSTFIMTILVSFSRPILILVYTHLLLLDQGAQLWWRWANVAWTLTLWVVEIILSSAYADDDVIVKSWKMD